MKKLNLKKTGFTGGEALTREQLKKVMGGSVPVTTAKPDYNTCYNTCMSGFSGNSSDTVAKVTACDNLCS